MSRNQAGTHHFFTSKRIILLLGITNLVTLSLLLNIHLNISRARTEKKAALAMQDTLKFSDNQTYTEQTELFDIYRTKTAYIVMMGSSLTQRVNWAELLERNDIANRGIGSDIAEGYLHRISSVTKLQPKLVILEIGANDLLRNTKVEEVFTTIEQVIDSLGKTVPRVVLMSCFYASNKMLNYQRYNRRVDSLNGMFHQLASGSSQLSIMDINKELSKNGERALSFALADGIHLNAQAYQLWKREIEKILMHENQDEK
nr:hypothetical protein [Chitinophagaceae bacterium]